MERFIYELDIAYSTTTVLLPKRFDAHSDWLPVFPSMRNGELVLAQDGVSSQVSRRLERMETRVGSLSFGVSSPHI